MEGIILAACLQRAGRSEEIPEVFPGVVYQNDCSMANGLGVKKKKRKEDRLPFDGMPSSRIFKGFVVFDGYVTQALRLLWCSSTCLQSFIQRQLYLPLTMKTLVVLLFLFSVISAIAALPLVYSYYGYPAAYGYAYDYAYPAAVYPYSGAYVYPYYKR
ncbi:hypothetical protein NPIL_559891 [Nephila pilipes]|uniref:Transmembrane protein n=1 Tax=Nephila pilipes TaxID=299642 RepID=A0A8X6PNI3_NEPPI|nr:hypothetical protein NPIL_559891 [Nephila pilipes]